MFVSLADTLREDGLEPDVQRTRCMVRNESIASRNAAAQHIAVSGFVDILSKRLQPPGKMPKQELTVMVR